jgi:hypothetical protein
VERISAADSFDLATRETIELVFPADRAAQHGLVIGSRQALLGTYVFYQALAYLGADAGHWLATVERNGNIAREHIDHVADVLGGIEVSVQTAPGVWNRVGEVRETGPLATDIRLVPLPRVVTDSVRLRLILTQGLWRIDVLALAELGDTVTPSRFEAQGVLREGREDHHARRMLLDPDSALTTLPGDEYTIVFDLPGDDGSYELFLESRGYYLEWLRQEWLRDQDPQRAALLFLNPAEALRAMAAEYKRRESQLEAAFWNSRYVRH